MDPPLFALAFSEGVGGARPTLADAVRPPWPNPNVACCCASRAAGQAAPSSSTSGIHLTSTIIAAETLLLSVKKLGLGSDRGTWSSRNTLKMDEAVPEMRRYGAGSDASAAEG